ncbi:hypothetical protein NDU88_001905 [Pleurodeles waltl]|uniref:Uncharacterized protein n=1 Tax=Pleurodeles waltl TaxID=8319 RepID=A0AAV7SCV9_PLEWA|nr:hypothetical protein NDU88_001905 [Pleurodeles waltl]
MFILSLESRAASPIRPYQAGPELGYERIISQPSHHSEVRGPPVQPHHSLSSSYKMLLHCPHSADPMLVARLPLFTVYQNLQAGPLAHRSTPASGRSTLAIGSADATRPQSDFASRSGIHPLGGNHPRYGSPSVVRLTEPTHLLLLLLQPSTLQQIRSAQEPQTRAPKPGTEGVCKVRAPSPAVGGWGPVITGTPG